MAAGDWVPDARIVIDNVQLFYSDAGNPPTVQAVAVSYRVQLPSGTLFQQPPLQVNAASGTTARTIADLLANALSAVEQHEGLTP